VTRPQESFRKAWLRGIRFAQISLLSQLLLCCAEPEEKPVPPLDPSKVSEADSSEDEAAIPSQPGTITHIPLGDLYQLVQNNAALIYDIRPTSNYKRGHVPGANSWPKSNYEDGLDQNEPRIRAANSANTPVVVYCTDLACPDAASMAAALAARGHSISILHGGYEAWKIAND